MANYESFEVYVKEADGSRTPVASAVIKVYNVTGAVALSDLAADVNGVVAAGSLAPAAGTLIRFKWEHVTDLRCGFSEQTLT
jgi:hypothetical protein